MFQKFRNNKGACYFVNKLYFFCKYRHIVQTDTYSVITSDGIIFSKRIFSKQNDSTICFFQISWSLVTKLNTSYFLTKISELLGYYKKCYTYIYTLYPTIDKTELSRQFFSQHDVKCVEASLVSI